MDPIPAVEVPVTTPKPPPRPELYVVVYFYEDDWYTALLFKTERGAKESLPHLKAVDSNRTDFAIFRLPAERPAPVEDWRERCVVVKCADGYWDVRNSDGTMWYADWCGWKYFSDEYPMGLGPYESEELARRALAAAPQPPEVGQ